MKQVLYSGYYPDDGYPFHTLAKDVVTAKLPEDIIEPDSILVIWGGSDINPALYGHEQSLRTYPGGRRDYIEWDLIQKAIMLDIPIIGVCRGAQMLCAAAGGYLIQHVDNHTGSHHKVDTIDGTSFTVNSIHHQMMCVPEEVDHVRLAITDKPRSQRYIYQKDREHNPVAELEAVWFPTLKGLAIQWHPEAMDDGSDATKFIMEKIDAYF